MPTKKAAPVETPEEEALEPPPPPCSNCGQPASWKTTSPAASVDYYCDACADQVYPQPWPVKVSWYDPGPPLEQIDA